MNTTRQRCAMCNDMCLPTEIASVPDENMQLCRTCGEAEGLRACVAADGSFVWSRATWSLYDSETRAMIEPVATPEQIRASIAAAPEGHIRIDEDGDVVQSGGRRVFASEE